MVPVGLKAKKRLEPRNHSEGIMSLLKGLQNTAPVLYYSIVHQFITTGGLNLFIKSVVIVEIR